MADLQPYDVKSSLCVCQHDKSWHWGPDANGECLFALASPEECPCNRFKPSPTGEVSDARTTEPATPPGIDIVSGARILPR